MKKIILLAIAVYFLIAPLTYHPDTKLTLRYPALENNKVWDIYGYLNKNKLDVPGFHYPPAHYWWLKIHYPISKIIGGEGFDKWLSSGSSQASFDKNVFRYNLATKFPLLVLGLISGYFIFLIVKKSTNSEIKGRKAALFWYFNPITLFSLVIMGQNDIVAVFVFLMGILFYKKWWLMAICWGLASGIKSYPIIWSAIFLLAWEKNIVKLILKTGSVIAVYFFILLPWLGKSYFVESVLNSGLSQRMFISNIPIGFDKQILIIPMILIIIGLNAWKKKSTNRMFTACLAIFQSCLIILGFSHSNPQWMLWTIPFLSIWWFISGIKKSDLLALLIVFMAWIGLTLGFDDKFLTWGLVAPVNPNLINFPSLVEFVKNKGSDFSGVINLSQSVLAGVSLWFLTKKFKINKSEEKHFKVKNWFIFIPWFLVILLFSICLILKVENKTYSEMSNKEVSLGEITGYRWSYKIEKNLKYFEVCLNNIGLNSQDKGVLVVTDEYNNKFEKEFSGFNAGVNSWLRVDVPKIMSNSKNLYIETDNLTISDGLLKVGLDNNDRWAINFYNLERLPVSDVISKLFYFWWWWLIALGISIFYFKIKEN